MFKPEAKVSYSERPYSLVNLKFISAIDIESDTTFSVTTPLRKFVFGCKHEEANTEWVNQLRIGTMKKNKALPPLKRVGKKPSNNGYVYSKDISKRLSIIETLEDGRQKSHKLKATANTLGRSASNTVRLTSDKYISRSHCKIEIIDNVPYLSDLGQAKAGTKLNNAKVIKSPLKPGDLIGIGKSQFVFQVKDGIAIFSQTTIPQSNDKGNASEESSSPPIVPSDDDSDDAPGGGGGVVDGGGDEESDDSEKNNNGKAVESDDKSDNSEEKLIKEKEKEKPKKPSSPKPTKKLPSKEKDIELDDS